MPALSPVWARVRREKGQLLPPGLGGQRRAQGLVAGNAAGKAEAAEAAGGQRGAGLGGQGADDRLLVAGAEVGLARPHLGG